LQRPRAEQGTVKRRMEINLIKKIKIKIKKIKLK